MMVNLVQWHAAIGAFSCQSLAIAKHHACKLTKNFVCLFEILLLCWHYFENAYIFLLTLVYIFIFLSAMP